MANLKCDACDELRSKAPNLIINGIGDTECASLKNNTGLSPSSGNDDCTDLENLNDCLVGGLPAEVKAEDDCDWKSFAKKSLENVWTVNKGVICSICGIWTNIRNLWNLANKLDCIINYMVKGAEFHFGETSVDTTSYIVAGKGVSFSNVSASGTASDVAITYISGGVARITGSCLFYDSNFTDRIEGYTYDDNGVNPTKSKNRKGNPNWVGDNTKPGGYTSELVYELRIKKSEFPQIARFFSNTALNAQGGGFHVLFSYFNEGVFANGQHGHCDSKTGDPAHAGDSRGHKVPAGWMYIQCRISWIEHMRADGTQYTPNGLMGIRMNPNEITC